MARALSSDYITEITSDGMSPILLIGAHFDSGDLFLWNGIGQIVYGGNTYIGTAPILAIDKIQEQKTTAATGFKITLSGLDASLGLLADNEPYQQRSLDISVGMLKADFTLVTSPYQAFEGFMDTMNIHDEGKTCSITVAVENVLISLERALDSKYTPEDQAKEFPGDTFFNFVADIQNKQVVWG